MQAWVYPTAFNTNDMIINKEGEYEMGLLNGELGMAIDNTSPDWNWVNSGVSLPLNQWSHIAATYDSATNLIIIYINGVAVHSTIGNGLITDTSPSANELWIGSRPSNNSSFFNGKINRVSIYNTAQTAIEIQNQMNTCVISGSETGLIAAYNINEDTGSSTITDLSPNANNGTLTNMDPNTDWITTLNEITLYIKPTATVISIIADQTVTSTQTCNDVTISLDNSEIGIDYYLRDDADNSIVEGPVAGTGAGFNFSTETIFADKTYNVYATKAATALEFDGIDDYVVTMPNIITAPTEITLETWVKSDLPSTSGYRWVYTTEGSYNLKVHGNGSINFFFDGTTSGSAVYPGIMNDNQWHHLAATNKAGITKVYVDGVYLGSHNETISTGINTSNRATAIGAVDNGTNFFMGTIDEVRLWSIERTQAEIQASMNSCLTGFEPNLELYYTFEEATVGTTVTDKSQSGNNGTLTNMDVNTDWVTGNPNCSTGLKLLTTPTQTYTDPALCTNDFVTTWRTTTNNESITIPTFNGETYNYSVSWGDGTVTNNATGSASHTYATTGTHTVRIYGTFPRIYINNTNHKYKIRSIEQWGTNPWTSMERAFYGCLYLQGNATDAPNLFGVTNMNSAFQITPSFNQNISNWNVNNVTNMNSMFSTSGLNQDINNWDVSNVTNMGGMFAYSSFNGNISNWDVSNVQYMNSMFKAAQDFNQDISNWNVSNVEVMGGMFSQSYAFNQDLSNWNVSNVTDMNEMFNSATIFNQDISNWNVSNVTNMANMFKNATAFNQDISNWNVSNVADMTDMFLNVSLYTGYYDSMLINWSALPSLQANVTFNAGNSNYCIGDTARTAIINTDGWTIIDNGIIDCSHFISNWQTTAANETITIPTFPGETYNYTVDWGDGVTEINQTGDVTHSYTTAGTHTISISGDFPRIYFNNTGDAAKIVSIEQWGTYPWTSMENAFYGCINLQSTTITSPPNFSGLTNISAMFRDAVLYNQYVSNWNTNSITNMSNLFNNATAFNQDISTWDVSNVQNMAGVFSSAIAFNQDISTWNVSNTTDMNNLFNNATAFNQDITNWNVGNVTDMADMFLNLTLPVDYYDSLLINWNNLPTLHPNVTFNAGNSNYCAGHTARTNLENTHNWTITDNDAVSPNCSSEFITTWQTTAANESITIPTTGGGYNYIIDWGDGTLEYNKTGNTTHTYVTPGTHTITISGTFPRIYFNFTGDRTKIISIEQWGANPWTSMLGAFFGCTNLQGNATDAPDLSGVADMSSMFRNASTFNQDVSNWDVSNVTHMNYLFRSALSFNQAIGNWDVSNVIYMDYIFAGATDFDQNLGNWDISNLDRILRFFGWGQSFFGDPSLSTENYDSTLIGWSSLPSLPTYVFGGDVDVLSTYCRAKNARNYIATTYGWDFNDNGMAANCVALETQAYLQGPVITPNVANLMNDDLRTGNYIPTTSPYTDALTCRASVFNTAANTDNSIVDWVWIELRDATDNTVIIAERSALLQRDGNVVDIDGVSTINFNVPVASYYIAIKHRNHLGIMSANTFALTRTGTPINIDFTDANNPITYGTDAQTTFGMPTNILGMWAGDANGDGRLNYLGAASDIPSIRSQVFNDPNNSVFGGAPVATYPSAGYYSTDINMDGNSVYSGATSDILTIRNNIFNNPSNSVFGGLPVATYLFTQQLPEGANN
jgi:surface protein